MCIRDRHRVTWLSHVWIIVGPKVNLYFSKSTDAYFCLATGCWAHKKKTNKTLYISEKSLTSLVIEKKAILPFCKYVTLYLCRKSSTSTLNDDASISEQGNNPSSFL